MLNFAHNKKGKGCAKKNT